MKRILFCAIAVLLCATTFAISEYDSKPNDVDTETSLNLSEELDTEQVAIYKECPRCDGKGYHLIKKSCYCGKSPSCPKCGGKGYTETRVECSNCGGSGRVRVK